MSALLIRNRHPRKTERIDVLHDGRNSPAVLGPNGKLVVFYRMGASVLSDSQHIHVVTF